MGADNLLSGVVSDHATCVSNVPAYIRFTEPIIRADRLAIFVRVAVIGQQIDLISNFRLDKSGRLRDRLRWCRLSHL